ncbi:MAG: TIR domain-containing protein [Gammaproteobacteria bacterium]
MAQSAMPPRVFVSHSSRDQGAAQTVCLYLEQQGIPCWIAPENLPPGQHYSAAVRDALNRAELLLVLFSSQLNQSHHALREIEDAVGKGMKILPVLLGNVSPSGAYESLLGNLHWLNASRPPLESHLETILDSVQRFLARGPKSPTQQLPFSTKVYRFPEPPANDFEVEIIVDDGRITKTLSIGRPISIGRTEGDVLIPDPGLSERHLRLIPGNDGVTVTVEDLNSHNGVYVRIEDEIELHDRDRISIGTLRFRIEEVED